MSTATELLVKLTAETAEFKREMALRRNRGYMRAIAAGATG